VRVVAEDKNLPPLNDFAIDDGLIINDLVSFIRRSGDRPLFVVAYFNALHDPYQAQSILPIPSDLKERRAKASFILEEVHRRLFNALREMDRFDDSFVIITGDHGLNLGPSISRLTHIDRVALKPVFLLKPSQGMTEERARALLTNKDRLIANIDIAPTIAELVGARPLDLDYAGVSLLTEVPSERFVFAINTPEWRRWPEESLAVIKGGISLHVVGSCSVFLI